MRLIGSLLNEFAILTTTRHPVRTIFHYVTLPLTFLWIHLGILIWLFLYFGHWFLCIDIEAFIYIVVLHNSSKDFNARIWWNLTSFFLFSLGKRLYLCLGHRFIKYDLNKIFWFSSLFNYCCFFGCPSLNICNL